MQTILGANGQIAEELAKTLYRDYTQELRLVSRTPKKITKETVKGDKARREQLTEAKKTEVEEKQKIKKSLKKIDIKSTKKKPLTTKKK